MKLAPAASILAIALSVITGAACGVTDQSRPEIIEGSRPSGQPAAASGGVTPASTSVRLYFVNHSDQVVGVSRADPIALYEDITSLLRGPTREEAATGITSAIPGGTELNSVRQSGSTAILDFSNELASVSGNEQLLAFAQIVVTADSLPDVDRVEVSIAGQLVNAPEPNGTLAQGPVSISDYASLIGH